MDLKFLEALRNRVYQSYQEVKDGQESLPILFPEFKDDSEYVWWRGEIGVPFVQDANYYLGKIKRVENIEGAYDDYRGIVADSSEGVRLYENYFGTLFRPAVISKDMSILVIDVNELRNNSQKPKYLSKFSVGEIIEMNFEAFPRIMDLRAEASEEYTNHDSFAKFYDEFANQPILF